jgi:hypothetical protein
MKDVLGAEEVHNTSIVSSLAALYDSTCDITL